jgi:hypothetical protein
MAPANRQARENYVAFGLWLLEQQKQEESRGDD